MRHGEGGGGLRLHLGATITENTRSLAEHSSITGGGQVGGGYN